MGDDKLNKSMQTLQAKRHAGRKASRAIKKMIDGIEDEILEKGVKGKWILKALGAKLTLES